MTGLPQCMAQSQGMNRVSRPCWMKGLEPHVVILGTSHFPLLHFRRFIASRNLRLLELVFVSPGKVPSGRAKISPEEWLEA